MCARENYWYNLISILGEVNNLLYISFRKALHFELTFGVPEAHEGLLTNNNSMYKDT